MSAPLAIASPPRGIPSANPIARGRITPAVFRNANDGTIFEWSKCVSSFQIARAWLGCAATGAWEGEAVSGAVVMKFGGVTMRWHRTSPQMDSLAGAGTEFWSREGTPSSIVFASVRKL
ncbi:MAG: hypothetical protein NVS9B14_07280 [Candidatus Acidiferrum sp.]